MRARAGFTTIELLVTVALVAVLAAIAVPVGRGMVARARAASCLSNLRAIGAGLETYLAEHGQRMPQLEAARASENHDVSVLETVLLPYVGGEEAFHCPADKKSFAKTGSSYAWNSTQSGRHVSRLAFFHVADRPDRIPLVFDKEAWHGDNANFLYADSSTSGKLRLATGNR